MSGAAAAAFVAAGVAITLSPTAVSGYSSVGGTQNVGTGAVLATATGGVAPYTYSWARVDSSAYTWTIAAPTAATTTFTALSVPEGVATTAVFELTVTGSGGLSAKKQITATALNRVSKSDAGVGVG